MQEFLLNAQLNIMDRPRMESIDLDSDIILYNEWDKSFKNGMSLYVYIQSDWEMVGKLIKFKNDLNC